MALKQKKTVRKKNTKSRKSKESLIRNKKFHFVLGILLLGTAFYLLVSFVSFLFFGDADQSIMGASWREFLFNTKINVQNYGMKLGALAAEKLMNQGFGLASFGLIYILVISGVKVMGRPVVAYRRQVFFTLVCTLWLSLALGLVFNKTTPSSYLYWGGYYGFVMSNWIRSLVGLVGLVLMLFVSGVVLVINLSDKAFEYVQRFIHFSPKFRKDAEDAETNEDEAPEASSREMNSSSGVVLSEAIVGEEDVATVVDENDEIKAIFEPDEEDLTIAQSEEKEAVVELEPEVDKDEEELGIKAGSDSDELDLTVEKKAEEEAADGTETPELEDYDPTLDLASFKFPTLDLLEDHKLGNAEVKQEELVANKNKIVETLRHYKIEITKIRATIGPTITLYEIVPAPGVRISKIKNLEDDIALSLSALGIRIIAPIPGRGTIGIEVPNQNPEIVSMHSIIRSKKFQESTAELPVAMGKTISNETFMFDLAKMPHILVAGATGQGKSVGINVIITSLLYKKHPSQLKFVFIDPKKVELNIYSSIEKHYLAKLPDSEEPVITDIQKVKNTLNSVNVEMDNRYDLLKAAHARNIKEYNKKFIERKLNPNKGHRYMPYIVVIIDEFADLIMTAGKEIELPIARIAQLARAVGIHMIIATQRPSTNIITGVIKANFPARIAFKVASMIDSRTILDTPGANQLIGKGDMLIASGSEITRVQCAFVDTPEVERICEFIAEQRGYPTAFLLPEYYGEDESGPGEVDLKNRDSLFEDAARVVVSSQVGSTSMIQRRFSIGYNRAGRLMDQLEAAGIVGPSEGSKARQVLIQDEYTLEQLLNGL